MIGSFYILNRTILYNTIGDGLGHLFFWKEICHHLFKNLDPLTMHELIESCYGVDRGRVTIDEDNVIRLLGTPCCKPHKKLLLELFRLKDAQGVVVNFDDDEHCRTLKADVEIVQDAIKLEGILKSKRVSVIQYVEGGFFVKRR